MLGRCWLPVLRIFLPICRIFPLSCRFASRSSVSGLYSRTSSHANPAFGGHGWICTNTRGTSPQTNCRPRSLFAPHDHVARRRVLISPRRHFSSFRAVYIERRKENEVGYALLYYITLPLSCQYHRFFNFLFP